LSEVLIFKVTGKRKGIFDFYIQFSCLFCGEGEKGIPKTFDSFETLIRHTQRLHSDHPHYKTQILALKKLQTLSKYYRPKGVSL
jgi:hypothetical protein